MIESLTRNWWIQLIRGTLAFALGLTALIAPSTSVFLAAFLVAAFAIGDGAMTITAAAGIRDEGRGGRAKAILGAAGAGFIVLGLVVLFWPNITVTALVMLFALWLIASGALVIYGARVLRDELPNSWVMTAVGAVVALAGLALVVTGPSTVDAVLPFAGWFGVIVGAAMAAISFRLRRDSAELTGQPQGLAA